MSKEFTFARYYSENFGNCTKTIRQVLCSTRFPRCEPDVKGPFLPCKRVLLDTLSRCGEEMRKSFLDQYSWFMWQANLLPEKNDPTASNFKKRCFEPPNFKTDVSEDVEAEKQLVDVLEFLHKSTSKSFLTIKTLHKPFLDLENLSQQQIHTRIVI
ncbi:hypothetical protein AC249_AIPGENE5343 [Exaiptasia diaphana]|nr:hypothetical protein AC249_AIPGENE5343 [Exaiptasia diaphana]